MATRSRGKENEAKKKGKVPVILPGPTKDVQSKVAKAQATPPGKPAPSPKAANTGRFEFTEVLETSEIASLAKKLTPSTPKEPLLRALKRLAELLESAPQDAAQLGDVGNSLAAKLLARASDAAADKDVKLYCTQCMVFILRMYAPDTPYDDAQLKSVFRLLLWALDRLSQPSLPTFSVVLSMLNVASETRLYLLMLDLDDTDLIDGWATALLDAPRADSLEVLEVPLLQVLCGLLEEGGSEVVSDVLLEALAKALAGVSPGGVHAQRLASRLLQRSEAVLRSRVQGLLADLVSLGPEAKGPIRQHVAPLMVQIQSVAPSVLLPVLPLLKLQLEAADQDVRRTVAGWVTCLMTAPDCHSVAATTDLTMVYLQRYMDTAVDVRLQMLEATQHLVADSTAYMQEQAVASTGARLDDRDERVRVAAVKALCEVAASDKLELLNNQVLEGLLARLLDKGLLVRKQAAEGLVLVFRHVAGIVAAAGCVPDTIPSCLLTIPARLANGSRVDPYVRKYCHEHLAQPGLMPTSGPAATPEGAAIVWALCWLETDAAGQSSLLLLLATKTDLANRLLALLATKRKLKAMAAKGDEGGSAGREEELHSLRAYLARKSDELVEMLLGPVSPLDKSDSHQKAKAALASLLEVKDLKVAERLTALCCPTLTTPEEARGPRKDVVERVGSKSPLGTFVRLLTAATLPSLISPATLLALAQMTLPTQLTPLKATGTNAKSTAAEPHTPQLLAAAAHMLCAVSKHVPTLMVGVLPYVALSTLACVKEPSVLPAAPAEAATKRRKRTDLAAASEALEPAGEGSSQEAGVVVLDPERFRVSLRVLVNSVPRSLELAKQGTRLESLPEALVLCLRRLCLAGPPKAAAMATQLTIHLSAVGWSQPGTQQAVVGELAMEAAACLTAELVDKPAGLAAVHTLSSIGLLAPKVFAEHAQALTQHVLERVMYADNPGGVTNDAAPGPSRALEQSLVPTLQRQARLCQGHAPPQGSAVVAAKGGALRALARGCAPPMQAERTQEATQEAVGKLALVLADLSDVDTETNEMIGVRGPDDAAALRLAAARALLKLSTRHDQRLPVHAWTMLALVLQDPDEAVRACFGTKLALHIKALAAVYGPKGSAWLPSKYAAILPLAAVDPVADLRTPAAQALRAYCTARRAAAQQAAQQAALAGAAQPANSSLQALPEFMLPYLIYLLAAHPDCPDMPQGQAPPLPSDVSLNLGVNGTQSGADAEEEDAAQQEEEVCMALKAFSKMLQMLLEPLLLLPAVAGAARPAAARHGKGPAAAAAAAAGAQAALANWPLVYKLLNRTRATKMEDPQSEGDSDSSTARMRMMCDLGLAVSHALVSRECEAAGLPVPERPSDHPASVVLPKNLFDCTPDTTGKPKPRSGDHLPSSFQVTLDSDISQVLALHAEPATKPAARKRKAAQAGGAGGRPRRRKEAESASEGEEISSEGEESQSESMVSEERAKPPGAKQPGAQATARQATGRAQAAIAKAATKPPAARTRRLPKQPEMEEEEQHEEEDGEEEEGGDMA